MNAKGNRRALTLRFRNPQVHSLLRLVADQEGVSMNELAEEFISEGVRLRSAQVEERLTETLQALRAHRARPDRETVERQAMREFAKAEANVAEPLEASGPAQKFH